MAAIEVITSQERELTIKKANGESTIVLVRIWNETVSNLTLMALGLLSWNKCHHVIETFLIIYRLLGTGNTAVHNRNLRQQL
jgi:hypothetical protein